jgi:hypothetical protein
LAKKLKAADEEQLQQRHPQGRAQGLQIVHPAGGPLGDLVSVRIREDLDRTGEKVAGDQAKRGKQDKKKEKGGGQGQRLA